MKDLLLMNMCLLFYCFFYYVCTGCMVGRKRENASNNLGDTKAWRNMKQDGRGKLFGWVRAIDCEAMVEAEKPPLGVWTFLAVLNAKSELTIEVQSHHTFLSHALNKTKADFLCR